MTLGTIFAVLALIFEVLHWAMTHDSSLAFYALCLATLALLTGPVAVPLPWRQP